MYFHQLAYVHKPSLTTERTIISCACLSLVYTYRPDRARCCQGVLEYSCAARPVLLNRQFSTCEPLNNPLRQWKPYSKNNWPDNLGARGWNSLSRCPVHCSVALSPPQQPPYSDKSPVRGREAHLFQSISLNSKVLISGDVYLPLWVHCQQWGKYKNSPVTHTLRSTHQGVILVFTQTSAFATGFKGTHLRDLKTILGSLMRNVFNFLPLMIFQFLYYLVSF